MMELVVCTDGGGLMDVGVLELQYVTKALLSDIHHLSHQTSLEFSHPYKKGVNQGKCMQHVILKCCKGIITVFMGLLFDTSQKILNYIEFTMEFWKHQTNVAGLLDYFLH
jgi:hypothetical protein